MITRGNRIWIIVGLCSLLVYDLYWLIVSLVNPYYLSYNAPFWSILVISDYVLPVIGEFFRLIGIILALFSAYLVWGPKPNPFIKVKKKAAVAIVFEAIYFLLLLPINLFLISQLDVLPIFIGFILQVLLVSPLLIVLSLKVWRYQETHKTDMLKWVGIAAIGYLIGIWINNVFKWSSTTNVEGLGFLLGATTSLNFLNSIITLSLSIVFAVAGFYTMSKKENKKLSTRLLALSIIMLSLYFVIFIINSALTSSLEWVLLTEIWPIALLGLGSNMLKGEI